MGPVNTTSGHQTGRRRRIVRSVTLALVTTLVCAALAGAAPRAEANHNGHFQIDLAGTVTVEFINAVAANTNEFYMAMPGPLRSEPGEEPGPAVRHGYQRRDSGHRGRQALAERLG